MTNQLAFHNTTIQSVNHNNQVWITSTDLAKLLQYADSKSVSKIYSRNSEEFTEKMSKVVKLTTNGINNSLRQKSVRIFSLRGSHLIAMFSDTPTAKEVRKWLLDLADKEVEIIDNYDVLVRQLDRLETVNECQKELVRIYLNDFQDFLEKLSPHKAYNISVLLNKISVNIGLALNYASTAHPTRIVKVDKKFNVYR